MKNDIDRRDFLKLVGMGGVVYFSGLGNLAAAINEGTPNAFGNDTFFIQLSDTHWGFNDPKINPDFAGTLKKAIAAINNLNAQPEFIMFTGDLTHTTDDEKERKKRMTEFRDIISELKVKDIKLMPGEHDAGLDNGKAFKEIFGKTNYTFENHGVHFIVIDNVSDPTSSIGDAQLQWLAAELKKLDKDARIVVFTHRPLFDLYPEWDWDTRDGAKALDLLMPYKNVTVFYGHIHQTNQHTTDHIMHHAAQGMMYPLPAPGSVPKKAPVPWDPAQPYKGLGYRSIEPKSEKAEYTITEEPVGAGQTEQVIKITAKKFAYSPNEIRIKKGVPVVLEFTSLDRQHGFNCPGLKVRTDINPGKVSQIHITAQTAGTYNFHCDIFCGLGHGNMTGKIIVEE